MRLEFYWYIDTDWTVKETTDVESAIDDRQYAAGNYFETCWEAQQVVNGIRELIEENK